MKEECEFVAALPMQGQINSLNASVAGGIILYEITRQRAGAEGPVRKNGSTSYLT